MIQPDQRPTRPADRLVAPRPNAETRLDRLRAELRGRPPVTFVEPDEYCQLATANRQLIRSDEPAAGIRGILDPESGMRFFIEEEKLLAYAVTQSAPAGEETVADVF